MGSTDKVIVFGKDGCPYCEKAVALLEEKGVEFEYHTLKTVPVIIMDGEYIGGFTELEMILEP